MNQTLIIAILAVIFLIIVAALIFLVAKFKLGGKTAQNAPAKQEEKELTLQDLIGIVSDQKSDKDDLLAALKTFAASFNIPSKQNGKAASDAKAHLNFITILASHKNADAKLIAFMSNELKKKNPEYAREIDVYEQKGTAKAKK
mgnify:FL=1